MEQAPGMTVGATAPGPGGAATEPAEAEGNGHFSGSPFIKTMRTAIPRLGAPIAADHSGSIVVDIPYGRGGGRVFRLAPVAGAHRGRTA